MRPLLAFSLLLGISGCSFFRGEANPEELERLRQEILALVGDAPAPHAAACQVLLIGDKPCGGHTWSVVYSETHTDTTALFEKAEAYTRLERALNQQRGGISDCAIEPIPTPAWEAGRCVATN